VQWACSSRLQQSSAATVAALRSAVGENTQTTRTREFRANPNTSESVTTAPELPSTHSREQNKNASVRNQRLECVLLCLPLQRGVDIPSERRQVHVLSSFRHPQGVAPVGDHPASFGTNRSARSRVDRRREPSERLLSHKPAGRGQSSTDSIPSLSP
jgi:hypothetical protein